MEAKKFPKIVFTLSLISFLITILIYSVKIYSIISVIFFLITFNIKIIMIFILISGGLIWKKKIYQ